MQSNQENPPIWLSADSGNLSSHFAAMSASEIAQELEQVLSAMTEETYDAAIIDAYLDELDRRAPSPELPNESDAWNSFQTCACVFPQGDAACCDASQEPLRPAAHRRKWRRIPFLVAALIACMLMMLVIAQAAGSGLLNTIISWSDETFHLTQTDRPKSVTEPQASTEDSPALSDLFAAVSQLDITEPVVPHHLPDGYQQEDLYVDPDIPCITAVYVNGDYNIIVDVYANKENMGVEFQKNPGDPELYTANGLTFYIMQNVDLYSVVWLTDSYCCSIVNVADKAMLPDMLDSVRAVVD